MIYLDHPLLMGAMRGSEWPLEPKCSVRKTGPELRDNRRISTLSQDNNWLKANAGLSSLAEEPEMGSISWLGISKPPTDDH
jgi:hypothetical protein